MADLYTQQKRSEIMRRIRSHDTKPELQVRRALHRMGYRFRLQRRDLPGKPDVVLPKWGTVILVHGCFWHGHNCCEGHQPKTRAAYWAPKLARNKERDAENEKRLAEIGWRCVVVWECETYSLTRLQDRLRKRLSRRAAGKHR